MKRTKQHKLTALVMLGIFLLSTFALAGCGSSSKTETASNWTLVNPEGVVQPEVIKINPHPQSLEGKTVALRWNSKEGGDIFLNEVARMLQENVKDIKIVKLYETMPETVGYGPNKMGPDVIAKVKDIKPDLIISSQAD